MLADPGRFVSPDQDDAKAMELLLGGMDDLSSLPPSSPPGLTDEASSVEEGDREANVS